MKYLTLKNLIFYIVFFLILYFENLSISGIRLSQIWKLPFYFYAIYFILKSNSLTNKKVVVLFFVGILISLKIILNANFNYGLLESIAESFYFLTLPISTAFLYCKYKRKPRKLHYLIITISFFLVISNIPFVFNLLSQKNNTFSLARFGLSNKFALNGLFYHTSVTSKILVVSVLILLTTYMDVISNKFEKLLILCTIIFGVYSIYLCYTRTGWILLIIGVIILFVHNENISKLFFKILPLLFIVTFFMINYVGSNESLQLRLRGGTTYRPNEEIDIGLLSSYRLDLFGHAINNVNKEGIGTILIGSGKKKATEDMGKIMGTNFIAHNRFIELFQYGGFIALILFVFFLRSLYTLIKTIPRVKGNYRSKLSLILFVIYFISLIPSHGLPVWADFLFGGFIALNLAIKERQFLT